METIESRIKEIGSELRTKIEPVARRAYVATKAAITAPDYAPEDRHPDTSVLKRMIAWLREDDAEPKEK